MLRGYLDRWSAAPGSSVLASLSAPGPCPGVRVIRLFHSDPNPAGPGVVTDACSWTVRPLQPVGEQPTMQGSFAVIPGAFESCQDRFSLLAWVLPTYLETNAVVASWTTPSGPAKLGIDNGRLCVSSKAEGTLLESPHKLHERQWCFLAVSVGENLTIAWGVIGRTGGPYQIGVTGGERILPAASSPLLFGAALGEHGDPRAGFDGKIAQPVLLACELDPVGLMDVMNFGAERTVAGEDVVARWSFGAPGNLEQVIDLCGNGLDGHLIGAPSLGVLGPPESSGSRAEEPPAGPPFETVHLHTDDLEDCRWPDTHRIEVPSDAPSRIYAVDATDGTAELQLAFVVTPSARPPVLLLVPTYTWQAYANLGRDPSHFPGLSHYALHRDASPVYVTTRLKPAPALEPGARVEVDGVDSFLGDDAGPTASASHLLMADLYVNCWLEQTGVDFGVITDEDLHLRASEALTGCRTLVLSAHPEYWTRTMLDALEAFLDGGGSVMYLGGNGLYWVTSVHPGRPHLLEVRRSGGSQTSAAPAGEAAHVFDPQPGGTWGGNGRPPDRLVGVGFSGFGWDEAVAYERTELSYADEYGWVFDAVASDQIGSSGLNMGGAVAFEFDRCETALAPQGCAVLATASPRGGNFFRSFEDGPGRAPDPLVRCDMTIRKTPQGGLVFSLGSIAAGGCLPDHNGETTDLARVCTNVLYRTIS
jgi:N,N-dimethylformamidase